MEIKKGISQMPEYPNQEINYVVPADGKMYYVLKDGVLQDGTIIATLDPKYAFDQNLPCNTVGAFKENGSVLIDFNKKEVKKIAPDLLLAVASKPISREVIEARVKEADEVSKSMLLSNATVIKDKLINEMGITGELLFSDVFGEANVYRTDSYNNKVGMDCSFIGKTSKELYFHTNDVHSQSKIIELGAFGSVLEEDMEIIDSIPIMEETPPAPVVEEVENISVEESSSVEDITDVAEDSDGNLKLDIGQDILDGFSNLEIEEDSKSSEKEKVSEEKKEQRKKESGDKVVEKTSEDIQKEMSDSPFELPTNNISTDASDGNEVLDNVIAVMKKMIEETNKLNDRITSLEQEIEEKDKVIEKQESKKDELNDLLDQANEVLENIE